MFPFSTSAEPGTHKKAEWFPPLISVLVNQANRVSRPEQRGIMGDNWGRNLNGGTAKPQGDAGAPDVRNTSAQKFSLLKRDAEFFF